MVKVNKSDGLLTRDGQSGVHIRLNEDELNALSSLLNTHPTLNEDFGVLNELAELLG
jgi:hypothetical protein